MGIRQSWKGRPPVILVCGPTDSGKTTCVATMANLLGGRLTQSARYGAQTLMVDLDPGQGGFGMPGTLGMSTLCLPLWPDSKWRPRDEPGVDNPHIVPSLKLYTIGSPSMGYYKANMAMRDVIEALAVHSHRWQDKCSAHEKIDCPIVINTAGWIEDGGLDMLMHTIEHYRPTHIAVLKSKELHEHLQSTLSGEKTSPEVIFFSGTGGARVRSTEDRYAARLDRIHRHFRGNISSMANLKGSRPIYFDVPFDRIVLLDVLRKRVQPSRAHVRRLLAVSHEQPSPWYPTPIVDYVLVKSVDMHKRVLHLLMIGTSVEEQFGPYLTETEVEV